MRDENLLTNGQPANLEYQYLLAKEVLDDLPVAVYACDINGFIVAFNRAAAALWGKGPEPGKDFWSGARSLYDSDGRPVSFDDSPMARTCKSGIPSQGEEIVIERHDGTRANVLAFAVPKFDLSGALIGVQNTMIDISRSTRSEEKQAVLAAIVNTSNDAIISKTLDGIITSWNKGAEKTFGYTEDEVIGKHISLLIPDDRLSEEEIIIANVSAGNKIDHFETIRKCRDGSVIPISLSVSPIIDSSGTIIGASKIARDISVLKGAMNESERNAENLRTINSLTKEISEDLDVEVILRKVADATTKLTGAAFGAFFYQSSNQEGEPSILYALSGESQETLKGFGVPENIRTFYQLFKDDTIIRLDDMNQDPVYAAIAKRLKIAGGDLSLVSCLAIPVKANSGDVIGGFFFGHPEPGRFSKEHENMVTAVASQASISLANGNLYKQVVSLNQKKDEFIGMASHELKTPLTSISAYLQILQRLNSDSKSQPFIEKTVRQVNRLSALVNDLLDVSKIEAGKLQLVRTEFDLVRLVADAVEMVRNSQSSHTISFVSKSDGLTINADPNRIEQLLFNLLTNAVKYSPSSDRIEVILLENSEHVTVGVKDFGIGIAADKMKNIFTRFYRVDGLNPSISGLGIGLYICKEITDRHQGRIWVESEYGKGSTFWFTLPLKQSFSN